MHTAPRVITVTSGKGGVGKTNIAVNLAAELSRTSRVVLLDADLGLANVDVLLGLSPEKNILSLFTDNISLQDILFPTPFGFSILPAASGVAAMEDMTTGQKLVLLDAVDVLERDIDFLIVDTGAGIGGNVQYFSMAAGERIVVLTPEPTSLADAYALIKMLSAEHAVHRFRIVINMAHSRRAGMAVFERLYDACDQFLSHVSLDLACIIPLDPSVRYSVMQQKPFTFLFPESPASQAVRELTDSLSRCAPSSTENGNIKFFWKQLLFR